jgi:hypothetical protein
MQNTWLYPVYLLICRLANWERMQLREFSRPELDQWAILWWAVKYHMGQNRPHISLEPAYQRRHRKQGAK